MAHKVFLPELNNFCKDWATPIPGAVTTYGGPLRTDDPLFTENLRPQLEALFENILLFDGIELNINGPNVIAPLLYNVMGGKILEELLEQDALSFVVWQPVPMMTTDKGRVAATFTASLGDGKGSEFDVEKVVDQGLRIQPSSMTGTYIKKLEKETDQATLIVGPETS